MDFEVGSLNREKILKENPEKRKDIIEGHLQEIQMQQEEDSKTTSQITFEKSFEELFTDKNIEMKTDISKGTVVELSKANTILEFFDLPIMKVFVNSYSKYSVSKNRKGRDEIVKLSTNVRGFDEGMGMDSSFQRIKERLL